MVKAFMKMYIGTDHAGFELKEELKKFLENSGYEVEDMSMIEARMLMRLHNIVKMPVSKNDVLKGLVKWGFYAV